jgi:hypothetical protein
MMFSGYYSSHRLLLQMSESYPVGAPSDGELDLKYQDQLVRSTHELDYVRSIMRGHREVWEGRPTNWVSINILVLDQP